MTADHLTPPNAPRGITPAAHLRHALLDTVEHGTHNPAAAIDMLIMQHDGVGSFGCREDRPRHVITCAGAEGEGPTPGDALHAWTIRARYLLAGAVQ